MSEEFMQAPESTEPEATDSETGEKAKSKTKAQLEAELSALTAEITSLRSELDKFKAALPKEMVPKEGHKVVFIKSNNVAAIPEGKKKFLHGSVNGTPFKVLCDEQVEVADHVAEALRGVIEAQKK
jgi:hypothetical protein